MTEPREQVLAQLLDECYGWLNTGASIDECLSRYPEHASALAPLLETVVEVQTLQTAPTRDPVLAARARQDFVTAASRMSAEARTRNPWAAIAAAWRSFVGGLAGGPSPVPGVLAAAIAVVMLVGLLTTGAVTASARALPGDPLYRVKTTTEQVRVILARDPKAREELQETFNNERLEEAKSIVSLGRSVRNMALVGVIEAINEDSWQVSDLTVLITSQTVIEGIPAVGARVQGLMHAPGDGTLVATYIEILAPQAPRGLQTATPTPTPTITVTPKPSATATATNTRRPRPTRIPPTATHWFSQPISPLSTPTEVPTATASPTATGTETPTPTVTVTPTPSLTPELPTPREVVTGRAIGWVVSIKGSRWQVDDTSFDTDGNTRYIDSPGVGDKVEAVLRLRSDGTWVATEIHKLASAEATPESVEFTNTVEAIDGDHWNIGGNIVIVPGEAIEGSIGVGDLVHFRGERRSDGQIYAIHISLVPQNQYQFGGTIESINGDTWRVGSYTFKVDGNTSITGDAVVGYHADVIAVQIGDGPVIATRIVIEAPTPTPSPAPTATETPPATATLTPEPSPTDTATPEASATFTPEPGPTATVPPATDTATPEASATFTPEPGPTATVPPATDTATPEASATFTPEPGPTATALPATDTATPEASATFTPEPGPTATALPATDTATPEASATFTPEPGPTATVPPATDTATPVPTIPPSPAPTATTAPTIPATPAPTNTSPPAATATTEAGALLAPPTSTPTREIVISPSPSLDSQTLTPRSTGE